MYKDVSWSQLSIDKLSYVLYETEMDTKSTTPITNQKLYNAYLIKTLHYKDKNDTGTRLIVFRWMKKRRWKQLLISLNTVVMFI